MLTPSTTPSRVVEGLSETPSRDELIRLYHQRSAASRPAKFPQSILWDFKDVRCDPNIKQSSWNPSRPPMHQALRNEDGSPLPKAEYERIRATARALRAELFTLPSLADDHEKDTRRPMSYFKTHHSDEWKCAVVKIELKHPVTGWCSAHWKSEHMLALVLRSKSKKDRAADPEGSVAEASRSNSPPLAITAQTESVHESSSNVSLTSPTIPPLLNITTPELSGTIIPSLNDLILSFAATSSRLDAIALDGSSAIPGEENAEEIADGARGPSKRPHSTTSKPTKRRRLISSPQKTAGSYYSQDLARRG